MAAHDTKTKTDAPNKAPATESKAAAAAPKPETGKPETGKTETGKAETGKTDSAKAEAAPSRQGMGEGQKPVSQAYKDNWNAIFAKKPAKKPKR
jgi:hypothetical protein